MRWEAVEQARQYQQAGKRWVVDLDLASFFDEVDHDLLMARVRRKVKDKRMLKLIRAFLNSGVMAGGLARPTDKGMPQGGPLSPLLSNILLDDLDRELERRGHAFCRYADDCNIYVQTRRTGERVMASISAYVEKRLKLKVNREKSAVARPVQRVFLGYSFTAHRQTRIRVPAKSVQKMKSKLKDLFRQGRGRNLKRFIHETLNPVLRGWMHYFRLVETKLFAEELDGWIRRRLRCIQHPLEEPLRYVIRMPGGVRAWGGQPPPATQFYSQPEGDNMRSRREWSPTFRTSPLCCIEGQAGRGKCWE